MKIKKSDLEKLIENFLYEAGTGEVKGSSDQSRYNKDPDADDFELTDDMLDSDQSAHEEYVRAVDAYRHPNKPVGNFPQLFKNKTPHIPSAEELEHVRRYQSGEIGGVMPSVANQEITVSGITDDDFDEDTDEDTEESPYGTQYSLEDTLKVPNYSSEDFDDVEDYGTFDRDGSQDVITYEDEDGNERTFMGGKEVTPGISSKGSSMIEKIRKFLNIWILKDNY